MFAELKSPRAKPRMLMHGIDHGYDGELVLARMVCGRWPALASHPDPGWAYLPA
jgi:hypothetical protein